MSLATCKAVISEKSPRAEAWRRVFGGLEVPILSPEPVLASAPGVPHGAFYLVRLDALSPEHRRALIDYLAEKFNAPAGEIAQELERHGLPILADGCTVVLSGRATL